MGITERKERDKQEMRKNIIDAAMHMFTHDGYENASIRKIADKIEYSPATIYLYYKDKDELLYDVQAECFSMLVAIFKKEVTAAHPFERLKQICSSYVSFGLKNPEIYDLMFIMRSPMNNVEAHGDWQNADDAFGILASCVHECIEQGLIRFDDVMTGALTIWSMGHGLVSLNNRCRMKVMNLSEEQIVQAIYAAMNNFQNLIKK
jgi:AcrR family transcriptional regulator